MKTEFHPEPAVVNHDHAVTSPVPNTGLWARWIATTGAVAWAAISVMAHLGFAPIGEIELLFLFAPLVIIPLGIELHLAIMPPAAFSGLAKRLQPAGTILVLWSFWRGPGLKAGVAAAGWMMICALIAGDGVLCVIRSARRNSLSIFPLAMSIAKIDLAVGGAWLIASRFGLQPMGIQEPIGLLTAVHFHFAGFATATIAAATLQFRRKRSPTKASRALLRFEHLVLLTCVLPYVIAIGFVTSPVLKMSAAVLFSAAVAALAIFLRNTGVRAEDPTARIFLQMATGAVFIAMIFSAVYAIGDLTGTNAIPIPLMARTHGLLNSVGFCLCGLLGWLVEAEAKRRKIAVQELP